MKNDYWNIKISTLDILKLDVYQSLIWKSLYPDMDKKLLQTTYTTENNFHEISFQISNLQCIRNFQKTCTTTNFMTENVKIIKSDLEVIIVL